MTEKCTEDNMKKIRTKHDKQGYNIFFFFLRLFLQKKEEFKEAFLNYTYIKEATFSCEEKTVFCSKKT